MKRYRSLAALLLALTLGASACGDGGSQDTKSSAKADTKAGAAADTEAGGHVDPEVPAASTEGDSSKPGDSKPTTGTDPSQSVTATGSEAPPKLPDLSDQGIDTSVYEGDWVFGAPESRSADDPRPPNCTFKVGQLCKFRVIGTYGLKTQDVANIEVGAYEDGAPTPAWKTALPNAKKGSTRWFIDDFPYRARPGISTVTILVRLLDATGNELARGKPNDFPVEP